jgi:uncharacterized protein
MHTRFITDSLTYTGDFLRSHWIYNTYELLGDAAVAFTGPCNVDLSEMVDLADVHEQASIYSEHMLHFIVEHFHTPLEVMVLRQRLFTAQIRDLLEASGVQNIQRQGDDLYDGAYKLSVSIATLSPVSGVMHFGINVSSQNTPVPTRGLSDYGLVPDLFAHQVLKTYAEELHNIQEATCKVRAVV